MLMLNLDICKLNILDCFLNYTKIRQQLQSVSTNFCLPLIEPSARELFIFDRERREAGRVRRGEEDMTQTDQNSKQRQSSKKTVEPPNLQQTALQASGKTQWTRPVLSPLKNSKVIKAFQMYSQLLFECLLSDIQQQSNACLPQGKEEEPRKVLEKRQCFFLTPCLYCT